MNKGHGIVTTSTLAQRKTMTDPTESTLYKMLVEVDDVLTAFENRNTMPPRKLLTPDEYDQIVREGRAAEALREYVMREPGRPSTGETPMTPAEKQRAYRDRLKAAKAAPAPTTRKRGRKG